MYFGRIVEIGATEQVFGDPRHPYTLSLLRARSAAPGAVVTDADEIRLEIADPAQACNYAPRCGRRIAPCTQQRPAFIAQDQSHATACLVPIEPRTAEQEEAIPS
jgi:oligopeptide/dipeptide ABC transporter ATP-binding protein